MSPEKTRETARRSRRFSYADYVELRGWEFGKFRDLPAIDDEEVAATDWDDLAARLIVPCGEPEGEAD